MSDTATTYTCESCHAETPEEPCCGYDCTPEGLGRTRMITLCDDCVTEYLLTMWSGTPSDDPRRAYARALGGQR